MTPLVVPAQALMPRRGLSPMRFSPETRWSSVRTAVSHVVSRERYVAAPSIWRVVAAFQGVSASRLRTYRARRGDDYMADVGT